MHDNQEDSKKYHRDYYLKNKEKILKRSAKRYSDKKDDINRRGKEYRKTIEYKATRQHQKYGISKEKAIELLRITKCEICGGEEKLHTDHSHKTGKVRGRLCMRCNRAMGAFKDSSEILEKAIDYLKRNGE